MWNFDKYETRRQQFRRTPPPVDNNFGKFTRKFFQYVGHNGEKSGKFLSAPRPDFSLPYAYKYSYEVKHAQRGAIFIYRTLQTIIEWSEI